MKIFPTRTLRIFRFVLSISSHEAVFVYTSKKAIYVKTIRRGMVPVSLKCAATAAVLLLTVTMGLIFLPLSGKNDINNDEDDKIKNQILMSNETDFTLPDDKSTLEIRKHTVKSGGESLSSIAMKYRISIDTICGSNNLRTYEPLPAGKALIIPSKDGILYTMRNGSNIVAVAKQYNVSLEKILVENSIKNSDFIKMGSVLFIPDAKPQNIIKGFIWPVSGRAITCGYGWRKNPFSAAEREFHAGLDIKANYEWVKSAMYGKVTYSGWMGGYGMTIIIAHPDGSKTLYAHLSQLVVQNGQYVKQGQIIAKSGSTGRSTGPHLHFEVIKNGRQVNPYTELVRKK
ncbi:MAG: peptidoglycan DD-metalloendopeptidase family protein [Leptospirales bacterium]|nr:peptidoglycan DD-metalloendopeptidase family protein [Leptospirales bacterium]